MSCFQPPPSRSRSNYHRGRVCSDRGYQDPSDVSSSSLQLARTTYLIQPVWPVHMLFVTPYSPVYQHPTAPVKTYLPCLTMVAPVCLSGLSTLARTFSADEEGKEARRCASGLTMVFDDAVCRC